MTTKQRELGINVGSRLISTRQMVKQNIESELEQTYSALSKGVNFGGVELTPEELKSVIGEDVFKGLQQDAENLRKFAESL